MRASAQNQTRFGKSRCHSIGLPGGCGCGETVLFVILLDHFCRLDQQYSKTRQHNTHNNEFSGSRHEVPKHDSCQFLSL